MNQVYLFGTCLIDAYYPDVGVATVELLERCGLEVLYPPEQTCCGQPPYNSGFAEPGLAVAKHTIETFSKEPLPLIVPSASCAGMIKQQYPEMLRSEPHWHERALELAERTHELFDFLAERLPFEQLSQAALQSVALHQSCSALRETGSASSWKQVLEQMPNVELRLPEYAEECCGFGGTFAVKSPEVSLVMTADKCRHLINTGADAIVSGDCGCLMSLSGYADKNGLPFEASHLASFVAQQFKQLDGLD